MSLAMYLRPYLCAYLAPAKTSPPDRYLKVHVLHRWSADALSYAVRSYITSLSDARSSHPLQWSREEAGRILFSARQAWGRLKDLVHNIRSGLAPNRERGAATADTTTDTPALLKLGAAGVRRWIGAFPQRRFFPRYRQGERLHRG